MLKHTLNLNKTKETSPFRVDAHPEPLLIEMPENRWGRKPKSHSLRSMDSLLKKPRVYPHAYSPLRQGANDVGDSPSPRTGERKEGKTGHWMPEDKVALWPWAGRLSFQVSDAYVNILQDEGIHSLKMSGNSSPLTPCHVPKRHEPSTAPLQKPEILKTVPQNEQQFCSLETAGNSSSAMCTNNVGLHL